MKTFQFLVAGGLLAFSSVGIAGGGSRCEALTDGLLKIWPLATCDEFKQIKRVERIFEDTDFLYEAYPGAPSLCFEGQLTGKLGTLPITARALSALTANGFDQTVAAARGSQVITAASVVTVSSAQPGKKVKELGSLFFRDTAVAFVVNPAEPFQPYVYEQLISVSGSKQFAGSSASLQIEGYEFASPPEPATQTPPAKVVGTICQ